MGTKEWTYVENKAWTGKCNNNNQSPINIDTELIQHCKTLCNLKFMYKPSKCLVDFMTGQNLKILYDKGSGVIYNNEYFKLKEMTFHTPSLHTIDGTKYDLEICLIHSLSDSPYERNGVIISMLYNEGDYFGNTENFVNQFINEIKIDNKEIVSVSENWGADMLLPEKKSFFVYNGSIHFPPCSQMKHIVMDTVGNIGPVNLEIFQKNLGKNIRAIQDLGNRSVFYNSGKTVELKERDQVKSNDKFLRCKKKETVDSTKPPLVKQEIQEDLNIGMSDSTKKYVKNIFILLNILTIFINALFLTLYLSKYEYAQKFIVTIVGTQKLGSPNILKIWRNSGKCI